MPKHRPRSRQHLIAALFGAAILLGVNPAALAEEAETPAKPSFIERASAGAHEMAMNALSLLGVNYRYGGDSPDSGFDCSGMVRHVVRSALGLDLPRTAREMSRIGQHIQLDDLKPGDLVFFNTMRRAFSHVGIYLGDNRFVHAPSKGGAIRIDDLNNRYWVARFEGARRLPAEAQ